MDPGVIPGQVDPERSLLDPDDTVGIGWQDEPITRFTFAGRRLKSKDEARAALESGGRVIGVIGNENQYFARIFQFDLRRFEAMDGFMKSVCPGRGPRSGWDMGWYLVKEKLGNEENWNFAGRFTLREDIRWGEGVFSILRMKFIPGYNVEVPEGGFPENEWTPPESSPYSRNVALEIADFSSLTPRRKSGLVAGMMSECVFMRILEPSMEFRPGRLALQCRNGWTLFGIFDQEDHEQAALQCMLSDKETYIVDMPSLARKPLNGARLPAGDYIHATEVKVAGNGWVAGHESGLQFKFIRQTTLKSRANDPEKLLMPFSKAMGR